MEDYKKLIKEFQKETMAKKRKERKLTQEQMAEKLHITHRAYGDLERGKNCFSAVSLIFLLLQMDGEELREFMEELCEKMGTDENNDIV